MIRQRAESGHALSQLNWGSLLLQRAQDAEAVKAAVDWHRRAAQGGNAQAQCLFGEHLQRGRGVEQNLAASVPWFRRAADQSHEGGQLCLANAFNFGLGVAQDVKQSAFWYRKAAEQGNHIAQFWLGTLTFGGHGVSKDEKSGLDWIGKAAAGGHEQAIHFFELNTEMRQLHAGFPAVLTSERVRLPSQSAAWAPDERASQRLREERAAIEKAWQASQPPTSRQAEGKSAPTLTASTSTGGMR